MARKKKSLKKYLKKDVYIGSVPAIIGLMKQGHAVAQATNLRMLDQETMSQEAWCNAMWIWFHDILASKGTNGAKWIEKEFRHAFEELSRYAAEDLKQREDDEKKSTGGGDAPEGFSRPADPHPGGKGKGKPSPRRRNGRTAE